MISLLKNNRFGLILIIVTALLFFGSMLAESLNSFGGNYSGFIHLKRYGIKRNPFLRSNDELTETLIVREKGGHDTVFYYAVAFDPMLSTFRKKVRVYSRMVDSPRLRFARIGYPLLINLFSFGETERFPKAMMWLVLLSHGFGIFFLAKILMLREASPYWALLYLFIPGLTVSCFRLLPESISGAFLLAGLFFYLKDKLFIAAPFLASAILIRESSVVVVVALGVWELLHRRNRNGAIVLASFVPYACWKLYLTYRLFPLFEWTTLWFSPRVIGVPFEGIWDLFLRIADNQYGFQTTTSAIFYAVLLISMFVTSLILFVRRRDPITIIFFCYSLLAVSLEYDKVWPGLGNAERTTFETFIFFIIASCFLSPWSKLAKSVLVVHFIVIVLYDFFFLTAYDSFRVALFLSGYY